MSSDDESNLLLAYIAQRAREIPIQRARNAVTQSLIEARQIFSSGAEPTWIKYDEAPEEP